MNEVIVFLADGMEEIEGLTVVDTLRRASIALDTVSVMKERKITGAHNIEIIADYLFEEADFTHTRMIVLPGGLNGMRNLEKHSGVQEKLKVFAEEGKQIAAICASPTILARKGLLQGKRATVYPSMEEEMEGAIVESEAVVTDGIITTGRGMGASIEFSLRLIEILRDPVCADQIAEQIVYRRG